jgi:hypothetical protein
MHWRLQDLRDLPAPYYYELLEMLNEDTEDREKND